MKKSLIAILIVLIPVLLFANVYQAFRYSRLEREISELAVRQRELLEENKQTILAISLLTSPERIAELAEEHLGLERLDPQRILLLQTPTGEDRE
ncbi:MAG: cell division protein FtsL [Spirochaetales bacterium]